MEPEKAAARGDGLEISAQAEPQARSHRKDVKPRSRQAAPKKKRKI
jgi:hypothetical protein